MHPTETVPSATRRTFLRSLARNGFRVVLAGTVLVGFFYAVENYRGSRLWGAEKERLAAQGTPIDYRQIVPGPVPDAVNFAELPVLRPLFQYEPGRGFLDTNGFRVATTLFQFLPQNPWKSKEPERLAWRTALPTDLAAWQALFRSPPVKAQAEIAAGTARLPKLPEAPQSAARDVIDALECLRPGLDLVSRGVRERTQARYPLRYQDGWGCLLPHLGVLRSASQRLTLRASALIAEKRTDEALADIETLIRLADTLETEPYLISLFVRSAILDSALQPVWEGVSSRLFTPAQASELQQRLSGIDLLAHWRRSMDMERAVALQIVDEALLQPGGRARMALVWDLLPSGDAGYPVEIYFRLAPRGWFHTSLVATSRAIDELAKAQTRDVPRLVEEWPGPAPTRSLRLMMFSRFMLPQPRSSNLAGGFARVVRHHTHLQLANVALALERSRLAQGEYPEATTALTPTYLSAVPLDPIDGQPLRYRRDARDRFTLWSVGRDGIDQLGAIPERTSDEAADSGDWVWATGR